MKRMRFAFGVILVIIVLSSIAGCSNETYPYQLTGNERKTIADKIVNYYDIENANIYKSNKSEYSIVYKYFESEDGESNYSVLSLDNDLNTVAMYLSSAENETEALKDNSNNISVNKVNKDNIIIKANTPQNKELFEIICLSYDALFAYNISFNINETMVDRKKSTYHNYVTRPIKPFVTDQAAKTLKEDLFKGHRMIEYLHQAIFHYSDYDITVSSTYKEDQPCEFYLDHQGVQLDFIRRDDMQIRFIGISFGS